MGCVALKVFSYTRFSNEHGVAIIELAIITALLIAVSLPILTGVLVPEYLRTSLDARVVAGFDSSTVSTNSLQILDHEGFQMQQDIGTLQTNVQNRIIRLQQISGTDGLCGVVLRRFMDSAGNVQNPDALERFASWGASGEGECVGPSNPTPPQAILAFESSLDPLQPGMQLGFVAFRGDDDGDGSDDMFSNLRVTTDFINDFAQ